MGVGWVSYGPGASYGGVLCAKSLVDFDRFVFTLQTVRHRLVDVVIANFHRFGFRPEKEQRRAKQLFVTHLTSVKSIRVHAILNIAYKKVPFAFTDHV